MRPEDIEIHVGEPSGAYQEIGPVKAEVSWSLARHAISGRPTMEAVYSKLREKALAVGANAVIRCEFKDYGSLIRMMRGHGVAVVLKETLTKKCPYCAEDIKFEAIVCRYCGRDLARTRRRRE